MSTKTLDELKEEFLAEQTELKHYGVPGMRWGKRNASGGASDGASSPKPPSRRQKVRAAEANAQKALFKGEFNDPRSEKTKKLGKAATITAIGAVGAFGVGRALGSPEARLGANLVSMALSGTSLVLSAKSAKSTDDDFIREYSD